MTDLDVTLRSAEGGDRAYVASTWIRGYAELARVPRPIYLAHHPRVVDSILADPEVRLVVACSPDETTALHGWACARRDVLHAVYVAHDLRGVGLGRRLIRTALGGYPASIVCTHRWPGPSSRMTFNPYLLGMLP